MGRKGGGEVFTWVERSRCARGKEQRSSVCTEREIRFTLDEPAG